MATDDYATLCAEVAGEGGLRPHAALLACAGLACAGLAAQPALRELEAWAARLRRAEEQRDGMTDALCARLRRVVALCRAELSLAGYSFGGRHTLRALRQLLRMEYGCADREVLALHEAVRRWGRISCAARRAEKEDVRRVAAARDRANAAYEEVFALGLQTAFEARMCGLFAVARWAHDLCDRQAARAALLVAQLTRFLEGCL